MDTPTPVPHALALFGGGVRGLYAYYGMWRALQELSPHYLQQLDTFMGSSVGSIMATLFAIQPPNLEQIIMSFSFQECCQLDLSTLLEYYGLDTGNQLVDLLQDIFQQAQLDPKVTFDQLYQQTQITLSVVSANISRQRPQYFNRFTAPNLPIIVAIRASFAIPFLFTPVVIGRDIYLDLDETPVDQELLQRLKIPRNQLLLASMVSSTLSITNPSLPCQQLDDFQHYSHLIIRYLNRDRHPDRQQGIMVNTGTYSLINSFNLTTENKKYLYHLAYQSTVVWIHTQGLKVKSMTPTIKYSETEERQAPRTEPGRTEPGRTEPARNQKTHSKPSNHS